MNSDSTPRISAFVAYLLPIFGWLYVILFQRKSAYAVFHTRQAIGLFIFLLIVFGAWIVVGYVLAWIPFGFIVSMALFTMVITAFIYGIIAWVIGMVNALKGKVALLPIFGKIANNLPL
jgi:uncharacterized membrane protein